MSILLETNFPKLKFFKRGKVRDIYDLGNKFLIVSTDRLSAFDVILQDGIPYKGEILTKISKFWFEKTKDILPNHLISTNVEDFSPEAQEYRTELEGRTMLVRKAELIPLECIVRGYISGSGWKEYKAKGSICGIELPHGLTESEKLSEPIFTPSTKAEIGKHDENISEAEGRDIVGNEIFEKVKDYSLRIYKLAAEYAESKGIIIADTKFEFGIVDGEIILIDEVLTPDSSRFWPIEDYEKGRAQKSFDKQYVRDYLLSINFDKQPPAPKLPKDIIENTTAKYNEALEKLTGESIL